LSVSCKGVTGVTCNGTVKLMVKVKKGKKSGTVTLASVSYSLTPGRSKTVKVKLSRTVLALLKKTHHIRVSVTGPGVKSTIGLG
ncbi:MAG: hypothetical protein WAL03_19075, partial [Pseudolabrys sp.]